MNDAPKKTNPNEKPGQKQKPKGMGGVFIIFLLLLALFFVVNQSGEGSKKSLYDFWRLLYNGEFSKVQLTQQRQFIGTYYKDGSRRRLEASFDRLTEEESNTIRELQARTLDDRYDQNGIEAFVGDLQKGKIDVVKAWIIHETASRRDPSLPRAKGPAPIEKIYLTALILDDDKELYVRAPQVGGKTTIQELVSKLRSRGVPLTHVALSPDPTFEVQPGEGQLTMFLMSIIPWVLLFGIFWFFILRQMRSPGGGGGVLSFGRSRAARYSKEQRTKISLSDVQGMDEAKEEVAEIIEFLKNRGKFQKLGGRIPRGVLLVGPPGTGKTLLAKAIAGEADVPFFSISGSDFVEMFVGVGASRVRDLFKQARESSPCLIFLDEIDAVGRKRGTGMGGGHDEREQTLNAILVEMDGFDTDEGIILIGATNRPDVLDPALLRPGRFDRQVVIDMPDVAGREAILRVHARKVKTSKKVEFDRLARATPGFSGAELASLINEAAILAAMKGATEVEMNHFEEARDRVRWGREKRTRRMQDDDRKVTAYHEAGHALIGARTPEVDPVHKVTIIARGMALGATMYLPDKDDYHMRRSKLLGMITMSYGGRIAEDIVFGDISAGAQNDIQQATRIARTMVAEWGMSDRVGPINYAASPENNFLGHDFHFGHEHSETTAKVIDEEVKELCDDCYQRAKDILTRDRDILDNLAEALMRYETITGDEVEAIVAGTPVDQLRPKPPKPISSDTELPAAGSPESADEKRGEDPDLGLSGAEGLAT